MRSQEGYIQHWGVYPQYKYTIVTTQFDVSQLRQEPHSRLNNKFYLEFRRQFRKPLDRRLLAGYALTLDISSSILCSTFLAKSTMGT